MPDDHEPIDSPDDALRAIEPLRRELEAADPRGTATEAVLRVQAMVRVRYITTALGNAGVGLTAYTLMSARWLAGQPLERIAVVLDWLRQAGEAGNVALLAKAAEYVEPCPARSDGRCPHGDWAACERTDVAWQLKGLDPAGARRHALEALRED